MTIRKSSKASSTKLWGSSNGPGNLKLAKTEVLKKIKILIIVAVATLCGCVWLCILSDQIAIEQEADSIPIL